MLPQDVECRRPADARTLTRLSASLRLVVLLAIAVGGLAACGFEPLMARKTAGDPRDQLGRIRVGFIDGRSGQILRNQLLDALGAGGQTASAYVLDVRLSEPRQEIAIRRDTSASRVAYTAEAVFTLRDPNGTRLFSGSSFSSSTYEATDSEFASIAGQLSARDRAMGEIGADIRSQLAAYFSRQRSTRGGDAADPSP